MQKSPWFKTGLQELIGFHQWSGRFLGITGWDPSICKPNRLHVDISFIKLMYILKISLKWSVIFLQSWTSTGYISNSNGSFVTNCRFSRSLVFIYDRGGPAVGYKRTGWLREVTGWSSRLQEITGHFRGIYRIYPNVIKENWRMSTCKPVELANTRISTGYAQKSPQSLVLIHGATESNPILV